MVLKSLIKTHDHINLVIVKNLGGYSHHFRKLIVLLIYSMLAIFWWLILNDFFILEYWWLILNDFFIVGHCIFIKLSICSVEIVRDILSIRPWSCKRVNELFVQDSLCVIQPFTIMLIITIEWWKNCVF